MGFKKHADHEITVKFFDQNHILIGTNVADMHELVQYPQVYLQVYVENACTQQSLVG